MLSFFIDRILTKSTRLSNWMFAGMLFGIYVLLKIKRFLLPAFKQRLQEKDFTAQIKTRDDSTGRTYTFRDGNVSSLNRVIADPDLCMLFRDASAAVQLMTAPKDYLKQINAMKNFVVDVQGPDKYAIWFMQTLKMLQQIRSEPEYGTPMGKGVVRYTNNTNGGPVFVYVKKGRIIRITPIEFDDNDAEPWTIEARGKTFTPPRKGTLNPLYLGLKSLIYSPDRLLYPMKRVDFDPAWGTKLSEQGYFRI